MPCQMSPNFSPLLLYLSLQMWTFFPFPLKKGKKDFALWHQLLPFSSYFGWRGHTYCGNIFREVKLNLWVLGLFFFLWLLVRRNRSHCSLCLDTRKLIWEFFPLYVSFPFLFLNIYLMFRKVFSRILWAALHLTNPSWGHYSVAL